MAKISVLGAGGWGMALAITAFNNGCNVSIWSPFENEVKLLQEKRTNEKLLKDIYLPEGIIITNDLSCVEGDTVTIIATPSIAVADVAQKLSQCKDIGIVINVSKGFQKDTLKRLSEVIEEHLPTTPIVALTGPSHAEEVARNIPTSIVSVSKDMEAAKIVQEIMSNETLRVYTADDLIGAELGGAIKNVIAVAAGFCDGLGLGDNSKAALITRGLAEMIRLGTAMGAKEYTFSGLTGLGDLIVTCTSKHSRNNRFGFKIGSGIAIKDALEQVGTVEGYYAAKMTYELSQKYNVEMPIVTQCYMVLYENKDINTVVYDLMTRPNGKEY